MSKTRFPSTALLLALLTAAPAAVAESTTWRFDPLHTQVVFFADHLGFSHGIGRIRISQGWLRFDADDWSSAEFDVALDLASLDMGDEKWTQTVRSAQFFDTGRWPQARFTSSSAEKTAADRGIVHGILTLRGISKPVALEVTLNRIGRDPYAFKTKAGFSARTTLNRFDFGMQRYRDVVGAEVELRIEIEAIRDPKAAEGKLPDVTEEH